MKWLYGIALGLFTGFALSSVLGQRPGELLRGLTGQLGAVGRSAADLSRGARPDSLGGLMPDERVTRAVREGLQARGLAATRIDVTTVDGVVYLRGRVASADERTAIVGVAQDAPGTVRVEDELKLPDPGEASV